jgi:hypothetical protein
MKCECGYNAFYFQWFYENKRYDVYKCGYLTIESKKRTRCDLFVCNYISDIENAKGAEAKKNSGMSKKIDAEKTYKDELIRYIHLSQITQNFSKKYRANYIANINYLLKKLNFKLYFEEKESLESLKQRITGQCIAKPNKKNKLPINLVEYPEYLALKEEVKIKPKNPKKKTSSVRKKTTLMLSEDDEETNQLEENKKQEEVLLSESESEDEEDNSFDVDNYDSVDECEDFEDGGAFSD